MTGAMEKIKISKGVSILIALGGSQQQRVFDRNLLSFFSFLVFSNALVVCLDVLCQVFRISTKKCRSCKNFNQIPLFLAVLLDNFAYCLLVVCQGSFIVITDGFHTMTKVIFCSSLLLLKLDIRLI